jgi:hypothetical protein
MRQQAVARNPGMGAALALIALIGGAASLAIVGWHGILLGALTASLGGSLCTLLAAVLASLLRKAGHDPVATVEHTLDPVSSVPGETSPAA